MESFQSKQGRRETPPALLAPRMFLFESLEGERVQVARSTSPRQENSVPNSINNHIQNGEGSGIVKVTQPMESKAMGVEGITHAQAVAPISPVLLDTPRTESAPTPTQSHIEVIVLDHPKILHTQAHTLPITVPIVDSSTEPAPTTHGPLAISSAQKITTKTPLLLPQVKTAHTLEISPLTSLLTIDSTIVTDIPMEEPRQEEMGG